MSWCPHVWFSHLKHWNWIAWTTSESASNEQRQQWNKQIHIAIDDRTCVFVQIRKPYTITDTHTHALNVFKCQVDIRNLRWRFSNKSQNLIACKKWNDFIKSYGLLWKNTVIWHFGKVEELNWINQSPENGAQKLELREKLEYCDCITDAVNRKTQLHSVAQSRANFTPSCCLRS